MRSTFIMGTATAAMLAAASIAWVEGPGREWTLAHDVQKYYRCLPFKLYAVRPIERDRLPRRGELVSFRSPEHVERFTGQFEVIKFAIGLEGDEWSIAQGQVAVNGVVWGDLHLLETLGMDPNEMEGRWQVPPGHVLVMGTNPASYDSRYWGPLRLENIIGRAYALL